MKPAQIHPQTTYRDNLGEVRRAKGIRLVPLAFALGISPAYLSMLETGKRPWSDTLYARWNHAVITTP